MVQQSDGKKEIETWKLVKYLHGIDNSKYTSINIHGDEYVTLYTNGYDVKTGEKISADNAIGQIHFQKTGKKITVSTYGDVRLNFSENKLNYIPNAYVNFTLNRNQDTMNTFKKLLTDIWFMTDENIEIVASSTQLLNSNYDRR